jgi:hypothetical protein
MAYNTQARRADPDAATSKCLAPSMLFDAMRAFHAGWVRAGWIAPSIIASGRLERMLDFLEKLALGPWARRV